MQSIRRRLIVLACSVLACQVAAMVAVPALLCQGKAAAATDGSGLLCECKEVPGAECPMHAGKKQSSGQESGNWRSCAGFGDRTAVLTLLTSGARILEISAHAIIPATSGVALVALNPPILNTERPPTSPPPRS